MRKIIAIFAAVAICGAGIYYFYFFKKNRDFSEIEKMVQDFQELKDKEGQLEKFVDVDKVEAKKMIEDKNVKVIDVSGNYKKGHLPGALNYYLSDGSLDEVIAIIDKNAKYIIYSINDESSIAGSQKLVNSGFKNVYRLNGNFEGWIGANFPIEFDLAPISGSKGSGKIIRSFNSQTEEYSYEVNAKIGELKDKEFYQAFFFNEKPQETFGLGILEKEGNSFILDHASNQDFKRFDSLVIVLSDEGDINFAEDKIVLGARINNFE